MAKLSELMNRAARECRVKPPAAWVPATALTFEDMKDYLKDTCEELLQRLDWPNPVTIDLPIVGTGAENYNLPSDFLRVTRDELAVYEPTTTRRACIPITSNGAWSHLKQLGSAGGNRYYRIQGSDGAYKIGFYRPLEPNQRVIASYVTRNWNVSGTTFNNEWNVEEAECLFPADLVRLGVVWRFRRAKGMPYTDRLNEYEGRLSRLINDARGIRSISFGEPPSMRSPFDIPVPDFIPPA